MRNSLLISFLMHVLLIGFTLIDIDFFAQKQIKNPPAILMVDLTKVQISNKTNLPQKIDHSKQSKPAQTKPQETKKANPVKKESKPTPPKENKQNVMPKEKPVPKNAAPVKTDKKSVTETKKSAPQKPAAKKNYDFKSLLASVEKVRKDPSATQPQNEHSNAIADGEEVNLNQILTISERDLIAYKLKECWNVDAGIEGVEGITINIQASINKDGRVREIKIKNPLTSPAIKSVAESAKRAILICDNKGDDSPFKILADKYAAHYNQWKELDLSFNPLEGSIF